MTVPTKAHPTDACFDIYLDEPNACYDIEVEEDGVIKTISTPGIEIPPYTATVPLHTGFATEIPEGYFCSVFARSGLGIKKNLRPSNCVGIIDSGYRGEWLVALYNDSDKTRYLHHGDRVAQFAILPVPEVYLEEVEELDDTERGTGGFGSSGSK